MQMKAATVHINKGGRRPASRNVLPIAALVILSFIFVFPFLWMISTSLRTFQEASTLSISLIPKKVIWSNYIDIFVKIPLFRYILNTLFITVMCVIGHLASSSLAAYGISHIDWKGKNIVFVLVLVTMMIPIHTIVYGIQQAWNDRYIFSLDSSCFFGVGRAVYFFNQTVFPHHSAVAYTGSEDRRRFGIQNILADYFAAQQACTCYGRNVCLSLYLV